MTDLIKKDTVLGKDALHNDLLPWRHTTSALQRVHYHSVALDGEAVGLVNWPFGRLSWVTGLNAEIGWDITTAAGTWTALFYVMRRNDYPIIQAKVDGVNLGATQDQYNATHAGSLLERTGIVLTRGRHRFTIKAVGKNASSTGYITVLAGLNLTRTA